MLEQMFESVRTLLNSHNQVIGEGNPGYVNPDEFLTAIKVAGGTSEERLKRMSHEDILHFLPKTNYLPIMLAKDIAKVFRGNDSVNHIETDTVEAQSRKPVTSKKADRMSLRELIQNYDPEENNAVSKRLKEVSRNEPFIVFSTDNAVNVEVTLKLLLEVKGGFDGRTDYKVGNDIFPVYKVGERTDYYVDENPLYDNRPLRPDGTCDQTGRSWEGVELKIRQLVRLAVATGELHVSLENANNILDMVLSTDAWSKLTTRYRKATLKFNELSKTGELPKLKMALGVARKRPFEDGKKVVFIKESSPKNKRGQQNAGIWQYPIGGGVAHPDCIYKNDGGKWTMNVEK